VNPSREPRTSGNNVDILDLLDMTTPTIPAMAKKAFKMANA
jgi:hypothetical protein